MAESKDTAIEKTIVEAVNKGISEGLSRMNTTIDSTVGSKVGASIDSLTKSMEQKLADIQSGTEAAIKSLTAQVEAIKNSTTGLAKSTSSGASDSATKDSILMAMAKIETLDKTVSSMSGAIEGLSKSMSNIEGKMEGVVTTAKEAKATADSISGQKIPPASVTSATTGGTVVKNIDGENKVVPALSDMDKARDILRKGVADGKIPLTVSSGMLYEMQLMRTTGKGMRESTYQYLKRAINEGIAPEYRDYQEEE